ncbi:hypothetical protein [Avibacterium avium]|uniref:hypothetical protein n=1 Tax=Avibacterium avium TaxID=751 RepID=UPI003BF7D074
MISEEEKEKRREAALYAKASCELDGIYIDDHLWAITEEYINGNLTQEEYGYKFEKALKSGC